MTCVLPAWLLVRIVTCSPAIISEQKHTRANEDRNKRNQLLPVTPPSALLRYLSIYLSIHSFGPWPLFQFLNSCKIGRTLWAGDQPVARPLPTHRINAHRHPCIEWDSNLRSQCSAGEDGSCLRLSGHCDRLCSGMHSV
jgi:hypothetical protein